MKKNILVAIIAVNIALAASVGTAAGIEAKREIILRGRAGSGVKQVGFKITGAEGPYEAVPSAITINSKGDIFIADIANDRIQKFDKTGKYLSTVKIRTSRKRYYQTIDDMVVDGSDNLYVASRHEMKILIFDTGEKLINSMNLEGKEICWNNRWFSCEVQIEKILSDDNGNIYLEGNNELIKFDKKGSILLKLPSHGQKPTFFLDESGNFYFRADNNTWEKYDNRSGNPTIIGCDPPYFKKIDDECRWPIFVDRNGFPYFYHGNKVIKVDRTGKKIGAASAELIGNIDKFASTGELYIFNYKDNDYSVEKISWK